MTGLVPTSHILRMGKRSPICLARDPQSCRGCKGSGWGVGLPLRSLYLPSILQLELDLRDKVVSLGKGPTDTYIIVRNSWLKHLQGKIIFYFFPQSWGLNPGPQMPDKCCPMEPQPQPEKQAFTEGKAHPNPSRQMAAGQGEGPATHPFPFWSTAWSTHWGPGGRQVS